MMSNLYKGSWFAFFLVSVSVSSAGIRMLQLRKWKSVFCRNSCCSGFIRFVRRSVMIRELELDGEVGVQNRDRFN
jgi:hypothetical protein